MATFTFAHPISLAFVSLKVVILHGTSLQFFKTPFMLCFFVKSSRFSVLTTPPMQNGHFFFENHDFFASSEIKEVADLWQGSSFFSIFYIFHIEIGILYFCASSAFRSAFFLVLSRFLGGLLASSERAKVRIFDRGRRKWHPDAPFKAALGRPQKGVSIFSRPKKFALEECLSGF